MKIVEKFFSKDNTKLLVEKKWAPAQLEGKFWAEPLIGSLILQDLGHKNELALINGCPGSAYAPPEIFSKTYSFFELTPLLKQRLPYTSFMIDNGMQCLSIVGIEQPDAQHVKLLFADPHIISNRNHKQVGLFPKTFTLEGKATSENDQTPIQKEQALYQVYKKLDFETNKWMLCYTLPK